MSIDTTYDATVNPFVVCYSMQVSKDRPEGVL